MPEREIYNPETGQYEIQYDYPGTTLGTPAPPNPYVPEWFAEHLRTFQEQQQQQQADEERRRREEEATRAEEERQRQRQAEFERAWNNGSPPAVALKPNHGWEFDEGALQWVQVEGRGIGWNQPSQLPGQGYFNYNNGSPPNVPLTAGHGWEWDGTRWNQVPGKGIGYVASTSGGGGGGGVTKTTSGVSGVPQSYRSGGTGASTGGATSPIAGSIPTLAEAAAQAKQLFGSAPEILKPGTFTPPPQVGLEDRNKIVQAILAQPDVMGQTFQDQLFEQQKEQQAQLAEQARARLSQATAARGLSAAGGQELLGQAGVEEGFINSLLSARRDVSMKAAEANRASRTAAVEMADAVTQGDFARAQAAYQTQLQANQIYNQLQMQAAELERGNVALVAQNLLAQREMALGEQAQSFDQYLRQLQLNEMIRQFNEQLALDYGKFGWTQQMGVASLFP
jgi:hypothetical protein